jgi:hypothetical protein
MGSFLVDGGICDSMHRAHAGKHAGARRQLSGQKSKVKGQQERPLDLTFDL